MKKCIKFVALLALLLMVCLPDSFAKEKSEYYDAAAKISLDTVFGFNNKIKSYGYNPAVFFIKNDGGDFSGTIRIRVGIPFAREEVYTTFSKKVFLPELSKKRIFVYFYCDDLRENAPIYFELVSDDGRKIFSEELIISEKVSIINSYASRDSVSGFLTVIISDKNYGYNFLSGVNTFVQHKRSNIAKYIRLQDHNIEYPLYKTLPDDSIGYDRVNLVVLSNVSADRLTYEQKRALYRYLNDGGNILMTSGENNLWLGDELFGRLLPGSLTGEVIELDTIGGYSYNKGRTSALIQHFPVLQTDTYEVTGVDPAQSGYVFAKHDDTPTILRKAVGEGRVFFTAFDPTRKPFTGRTETLTIFGNIINMISLKRGVPTNVSFLTSVTGIFNKLINSVTTKDIIKKIALFFIISFVVYVILLGPVNYFVLSLKRKLEYAWLTIPAISILFSALFLSSGYIARGTENYLFSYNIVKAYDSNNFMVKSFLSVFASRADRYEVDIERQNISAKFHEINKRAKREYEIVTGDTINIKDIDIKKWPVKNFNIEGYILENSDYYVNLSKKLRVYILDYNLPCNIEQLYLLRYGQVSAVEIKESSKRGQLEINLRKLKYYKRFIEFSRTDMQNFKTIEDARMLAKAVKSSADVHMVNYLKQNSFINDYDDFLIIFSSDPVIEYRLKGVSFNNTDKSIIIVPVKL